MVNVEAKTFHFKHSKAGSWKIKFRANLGYTTKAFLGRKKKTRKIFKFYFYVYKCVREESDLL